MLINTLKNNETLKRLDFKHPATWVATWFGCGFMRPAPGTWGTIGALPFGIILMIVGGIPALLIGLTIVIPLGLWASKHFDRMAKEKDSSMIVIDEVAGMWITLIPASLSPLSILIAFAAFRLFDIWKPWPVSWMDKKMRGAPSVMADDIMAGIYAALLLIGLRYVGLG